MADETGIREYNEGMIVEFEQHENGRPIITAFNEAGFNSVKIDVLDLLDYLRSDHPQMLAGLSIDGMPISDRR